MDKIEITSFHLKGNNRFWSQLHESDIQYGKRQKFPTMLLIARSISNQKLEKKIMVKLSMMTINQKTSFKYDF